jgi:hypothetical protein
MIALSEHQQIRLDVGAKAQVRVGSKVRLAAWQDPKNRGAATAIKRSPTTVDSS